MQFLTCSSTASCLKMCVAESELRLLPSAFEKKLFSDILASVKLFFVKISYFSISECSLSAENWDASDEDFTFISMEFDDYSTLLLFIQKPM